MSKVVLYQPPTKPWGTPNLSPFCIKLECYLRMAKVSYEVRPAAMPKAPKGKIPYVALPDGTLMGDSQLVIEHLERLGPPLDAGLSDEQRALGHVVRRMLDEATYFVGMHMRWVDDRGFATLVPEFKRVLPGPLSMLMPLIRRNVRKTLRAQGTGRHSVAEVEAIGCADWTAIAALLGERPFLLGEAPRTVDASLFAFVEALLGFPQDSKVKTLVMETPNLCAYRARVRERYWSDLEA